MFYSCFSNLKGFVITRPPLVVFTICLTALGIAVLSIAKLVSQADSLPNPDVKLDWNLLLERMAQLDLCVLPDESMKTSNISEALIDDMKDADYISVTALLGVAKELHGTLHNNTQISGVIPATFLGLRGSSKLVVTFRIDVNSSTLHLPSSVCAAFSGSKSILPATQTPPSCTAPNSVGQPFNAHLQARMQGPAMVDDWCDEGTLLRLAYHSNPDLTAVLTLHDKSVVNLHLMHTSYFLLVMAMTLVCYALLKGRHHPKQSNTSITLE